MSTQLQPVAQLTQRATSVLIKELSIVDTLRFLSQFRMGTGDHTVERHALFQGMSVKDIIGEIKDQHNNGDA